MKSNSINIKVCGLTRANNIEELAGVGVDLFGLIFYKNSPRYYDPSKIDQLKALTTKHNFVGVFVDSDLCQVLEISQSFSLKMLQLHGGQDLNFCAALKEAGQTLIKVIRVGSNINFKEYIEFDSIVDYFLLDTATAQYGGSGQAFDWKILDGYSLEKPFLLSGGISNQHITQLRQVIQKNPKIVALDLNSRFEISPGIKNTALVKSFIEEVRADEYSI